MNKKLLVGIFLNILGISLIVLGVILYTNQLQMIRKCDAITATIVDIKTRSQEKNAQGQIVNKHDSLNYTTYIDFSWNGYEYSNAQFAYYQSNWNVGDQIQIYGYYDGETLTLLSNQANKSALIGFSVFGLLCLIIGIVACVTGIRERTHR